VASIILSIVCLQFFMVVWCVVWCGVWLWFGGLVCELRRATESKISKRRELATRK
jgi:hypothetical protein